MRMLTVEMEKKIMLFCNIGNKNINPFLGPLSRKRKGNLQVTTRLSIKC